MKTVVVSDGWEPHVTHCLRAVRGSVSLAVTVGTADGAFYALAVVTSADRGGLDAVLAAHGHKNLGTFKTPREARAAGELYADNGAWDVDCSCQETL